MSTMAPIRKWLTRKLAAFRVMPTPTTIGHCRIRISSAGFNRATLRILTVETGSAAVSFRPPVTILTDCFFRVLLATGGYSSTTALEIPPPGT